MVIDDLRDLCQIWSLASLDGGATFISLKTDEGGEYLSARFVGLHMAVERRVLCAPPPMDIMIDGRTLRDSISLFPQQAELHLSIQPRRVTFQAGGAVANLALTERGGDIVGDRPTHGVVVKAERAIFLRHAKVLLGLAARKASQLILTGINMQITNRGLVLRACDGSAAVAIVAMIVATQLPLGDENRPVPVITPQAADLVGALELLTDDEVELGVSNRKLHLKDSRTDILLSGLAGEYPKLDKLPRRLPNHMELDAEAVQRACHAANLFDSNKIVHIEIADGKVALSTIESESGSFVVTHNGDGAADLSIDLDAEVLGGIVSSDCQMHYDHGRALVLLHTEGRYIWLSPVIRH